MDSVKQIVDIFAKKNRALRGFFLYVKNKQMKDVAVVQNVK